jgi:hypothetical protein
MGRASRRHARRGHRTLIAALLSGCASTRSVIVMSIPSLAAISFSLTRIARPLAAGAPHGRCAAARALVSSRRRGARLGAISRLPDLPAAAARKSRLEHRAVSMAVAHAATPPSARCRHPSAPWISPVSS